MDSDLLLITPTCGLFSQSLSSLLKGAALCSPDLRELIQICIIYRNNDLHYASEGHKYSIPSLMTYFKSAYTCETKGFNLQ